jgi:putative ABC transport system substrate-binding protein
MARRIDVSVIGQVTAAVITGYWSQNWCSCRLLARLEECNRGLPPGLGYEFLMRWLSALSGLLCAAMTFAIVSLTLGLPPAIASAGESTRLPCVGILSPYAADVSSFEEDVKAGLAELGYLEGQSIEFETVFADGRTDRLPAVASELVERRVDIIVTTTAPAVRAAKQATSRIPVVIGGVDDAVEQGFVTSLARPGGNITGTSWLNAELSGKRLDLLKQALPGASRIGVLREAVGGGASARAVMLAAQSLGVQVYLWELRAPDELPDVFSDMVRMEVVALNVLQSPMITSEATRIVSLTSQNRLAAIFPDRRFVEAGGLMSYGPNLPAMYRRAATYVDRILKGAKPAEMPVEQPTVFELVVSLRTARLQGLSISESILVRADEVIE